MIFRNINLFPGVEYRPMPADKLRAFVHDIQRLGMTEFRKMRLLQAVGRFCNGFAVQYCKKYNIENVHEFSAAAWIAIVNAVNGFDQEQENSFLLYLGFHIRAEYNSVIYGNFVSIRYNGDKFPVKLESLEQRNSEGETFNLLELVGDSSTADNVERLERRRGLEILMNRAELTDMEKKFITEHFGINTDGFEMTLEDIGNKMNRSKECIRVKVKRALKKMRKATEEKTK